MKRIYTIAIALLSLITSNIYASKLVSVSVLDKDYIQLYFLDGETTFRDDGAGVCPHDHCEDLANNDYVAYGSPLNTGNATNNGSYSIKSSDDMEFGSSGKNPSSIYRKSKLAAMTQRAWSVQENDYQYDVGLEHNVFLRLPNSLKQGDTYTIEINGSTNSDVTTYTFTYDIYSSRSEAVKVNVVGYLPSNAQKAADLYMWMGSSNNDANGSESRDYSSFVGNKVYIVDVNTNQPIEVGSVALWQNEATESRHGHKQLRSDIWNVDFTGFTTPGTYRLAVEGVGCSDEFVIDQDVYKDMFDVAVQGYFYMRIGQDNLDMTPVPRRPLWIPGVSPANTVVYMTSVSPYESSWDALCTNCDRWDVKGGAWANYRRPGNPTNPNAFGGHSDALDWDRHLGHVSNIYDMLLPYIVTGGAQSDDNTGIAESGNGIPDLLDEAQNEVDFWLRLRDFDGGYSHGLNNPDGNNVMYQAAGTGVAAWANAANASMYSFALEIAGESNLAQVYRDSAIAAYEFAGNLADPQLDKEQGIGMVNMSGQDFKTMAAAYLYNITGDTKYEDDLNAGTSISSASSAVNLVDVYSVAAYLFTPQTVHYTTLYDNMKAAIVNEALSKEVSYSQSRPSRRASDNFIGWMQTEIGVHRSIVAHAVADEGANKQALEDALTLEADYSLGRNPLNRILMTTASTNLENERSIENAFTSGWDDGTPGVHPGHTPYMNPYDWGGLKMGRPTWMTDQSFPNTFTGGKNPGGMNWPMGEMYFNTRYVYAHCEFTPQQTMRGKIALYAYLYGLGPVCDKPDLGDDQSICGVSELVLNSGLPASGRTFSWTLDGNLISGNAPMLTVTQAGEYEVTSDEAGCVKKDRVLVLDNLPDVNLGEDVTLCSPSVAVLDAGVAGAGLTYEWELNGEVIPDATEQTYEVVKAGDYSVIISASGCSSKMDEITVSSSLVNVKNDTLCGQGEATLMIEDAGSFTWHSGLNTDDELSNESTYSTLVTQTTTYYVEDANSITASVGPAAPGNSTWGSWVDAYEHSMTFTVYEMITLESVSVNVNAPGDVIINIYSDPAGTPLHTKTVNLGSGTAVVDLGWELTPGNYYMKGPGTTANLTLDNENGNYIAYPYTVNGVISITGVDPSWANNRYYFYYDWKVSSGNTCDRTPVKAVVLDPLDPKCNITSLSNYEDVNGVYPNPTSNSLQMEDTSDYSLYNALGDEVMNGRGDELDMSSLPSGMYMLKTSKGVSRIIKQ